MSGYASFMSITSFTLYVTISSHMQYGAGGMCFFLSNVQSMKEEGGMVWRGDGKDRHEKELLHTSYFQLVLQKGLWVCRGSLEHSG